MDHVSRKLATSGHARQVEVCLKADRAVSAADQAILASWKRLVGLIEPARSNPWQGRQHVHKAALALTLDLLGVIEEQLRRLYLWTHADTAKSLTTTLPQAMVQAAITARPMRALEAVLEILPTLSHQLQGKVNANYPMCQPPQMEVCTLGKIDAGKSVSPSGVNPLTPETGKDGEDSKILSGADPSAHETNQFAEQTITTADLLQPLRHGTTLDDGQQRALFHSLLFPVPSEDQLRRVVYSSGWRQRLLAGTSLGNPDQLADAITSGLLAGKNQAEIAREIRPLVQGVQSSARRVARTECMRVAGQAQEACSHALGDMVIGFQVRAVLDENTRISHRLRDGQAYYKVPKAGQLGMDQCPRPPMEADNTPAFNCRCFLIPLMSPIQKIEKDPIFKDNAGLLVPHPEDFSAWFAGADESRRRVSVGSRRYDTVSRLVDREPVWADFLTAAGGLVPLATLRSETPGERQERVGAVLRQITHLGLLKRLMALFGFLPAGTEQPALL